MTDSSQTIVQWVRDEWSLGDLRDFIDATESFDSSSSVLFSFPNQDSGEGCIKASDA